MAWRILFIAFCKISIIYVCIDDGSNDSTLQRLCAQVDLDHRFRIVQLTRIFGNEASLTAMIDIAIGDAIIPMDAYLQDPPEVFPLLNEERRQDEEVVLARRSDRNMDSF